MDGSSLVALADLLKPPEEQNSDEDLDVRPSPYVTPGSIGPPTTSTTSAAVPSSKKVVASSGEIWQSSEVEEQPQHEYDDPRPQPEYEMLFKQAVSTEDVFLGMGNKNPTTASCENLLVKIKLPGTDIKDVELDITDTFLDCRTKTHRLGLHLPHKVDSKKSKAKWISDLEVLEVTLHLMREYDFVNQQ